jgi:uncharacterized Tic20 family protein
MPVEDPIRTGTIEQPLQTAPNTSLTEDERSWGALCHFAGVAGVVGTLIAWMMKKDTSKWVDEQGKQAVNFHLTNLIIAAICGITFIGIPIAILVGPYSLIFSILAGMKVKEGVPYKYPWSLNLIK